LLCGLCCKSHWRAAFPGHAPARRPFQTDVEPAVEPVVEPAAATAVVINEIHYDPTPAARTLEYVELFNAGAQPLDLTGWRLEGGVDFDFPVGTTLPANGFLVVALDPAAVGSGLRRSCRCFGPWHGRLANDGDALLLRDARTQVADRGRIRGGLSLAGHRLQRRPCHQSDQLRSYDNAIPGAWRAGPPTPGAPNAGLTDNPPPFVHSVDHQPQAPRSTDAVTIRARVTDSDGVAPM
jgi:hypothetical protein